MSLPFPLASPTEGSYREPQYQARIELYAQNYFTPAEYQKVKSRGISFVRGDADMIRQAFVGENALRHKIQVFTGSAYVYDLTHALLLHVKRTAQQLVNVPQGLTTQVLMALLYNLKGFRLIPQGAANTAGTGPAAPAANAPPGTNDREAQLTALSTTDYQTIMQRGGIAIKGAWFTPERMPAAGEPQQAYPWSLTASNEVAAECVVAEMIELCRSDVVSTGAFSVLQRTEVFGPLDLEGTTDAAQQGFYENRAALRNMGQQYSDYAAGRVPQNRPWQGAAAAGGRGFTFDNVIRTIQLPSGQAFGPTGIAGLDEVFRMERERDSIIAILTQWATTGLGILLDNNVTYNQYINPGNDAGRILGNKPAYSRFGEVNGMGDTCGPGYQRVWYTGDPNNDKSRAVPGHVVVNGVRYQNPQATHAVCAPMTNQLRSMPYTRDVITDQRMVAAQRRARKRRTRRKTAGRRRR